MILTTVLAVVAIHDIEAYLEVRRTTLALAAERMGGIATRLADLLQAQARQFRMQIDATAKDHSIQSFAADTLRADLRVSVAVALRRDPGTPVAGAELWDTTGRAFLSVGDVPKADAAYSRDLIARAATGPAIGWLRTDGDSVVYASIARVTDGSTPRGYVVQWRYVARNVRGRQPLIALIGPDAVMYVGNARGDAWTDFMRILPRPPVQPLDTAVTAYARDGAGSQVAAIRAIRGTPWMFVVESPTSRAMRHVYAMMGRLMLNTAIVLVLVLAAVWLLGKRLTTPLSHLADAASAISAGDYSRRVQSDARDEVGTLATAFNSMADSIQTARGALEERSEQLAQRARLLAEQTTQLETSNVRLSQAVDEAVRTRDELAVVSAELDASLASAPVGFAFHDDSGRYRRVNPSLARLNGAPIEAHAGRLPSEVVPGIGAQLERHLAHTVASSRGVFDIELSDEPQSKPAASRHWLVSLFPICTADGHRLGVGSVVTDLTSYKQLERQLMHAQKMEAVGRLAGGVAHDFNNMLTAISGFGQFVLAELNQSGAEGAQRDMEEVLAAAERAATLTRQLLAFSRQQVLQPQVLDLSAVVAGLSPMLARLIGTDVRLTSTRPSTLGVVKADPSQIEQVIANLVLNARDAMPNGGTVVVETADADLDAQYAADHEGVAAGEYVMLAVTDSGIGMDADTRARAFDPFFTTKEPGKGTGLGLSTVYGIVKQSGGHVEVYSEPGVGTTFKVYLPRTHDRVSRETPPRIAAVSPNGQARLLVVDDDAHVLAAACRALERAGYVVIRAANGREALTAMQIHGAAVDLIVTDLIMPEMGGRELARRLAVEHPEMRLLFTSGYTAEAMNRQAVLEPGDAFLGKPFTPDALLRAVHRSLTNPDA